MRTIKAKGNTFNRRFGVIYFDLEDIDGVKRDTLQLCETQEQAEFLAMRIGAGEKAEVVKIEVRDIALERRALALSLRGRG